MLWNLWHMAAYFGTLTRSVWVPSWNNRLQSHLQGRDGAASLRNPQSVAFKKLLIGSDLFFRIYRPRSLWPLGICWAMNFVISAEQQGCYIVPTIEGNFRSGVGTSHLAHYVIIPILEPCKFPECSHIKFLPFLHHINGVRSNRSTLLSIYVNLTM